MINKFKLFFLIGTLNLAVGAFAQERIAKGLMVDEDNVAANGYDVVAYFDNRVERGIPSFMIEYKGATWYFATEENAQTFRRDPSKFEPVYGGYCAYGVSQGYLVGTDPEAYSIYNGRLYLNYNASVRNTWLQNRENFVKVADKFWPKLIS